MANDWERLREVWDRNTWPERIKWVLNCLWLAPVLIVIIFWYDKVLPFYDKLSLRFKNARKNQSPSE